MIEATTHPDGGIGDAAALEAPAMILNILKRDFNRGKVGKLVD